jgi:hypothetical protein
MQFIPRCLVAASLVILGCSSSSSTAPHPDGAAGSPPPIAGSGGTGTGGSGGSSGAGGAPEVDAAPPPVDAVTGPDASPLPADAAGPDVPRPGNGGPPPNVEGSIPPYEGPPVGPVVKMDCPGDPTAGFTEYKDTFKVEHPFDLPAAARFSIDDGIYTFWVMQGDKKHSPTSTAANPRTEARYAQNFRTGIRMFSADVFWEKSVTRGTVVVQVHTTATGIGPVYLVAGGDSVPPIDGAKVPGGLFDRWINLKVLINADTTASQYWVNNCLVASKGSGTRGDGNDYFKMGVYHCDAGMCRDRYKNVHLYIKQ